MCAVTIGSLPGEDNDDDDDDDAGDMSVCNIQATDDEVTEILRKYISPLHHIICAQIHHILCEQYSRLDTTIFNIMSYLWYALSEIYLYVHIYTFSYINNLQDNLTHYL